MKKTVHLFENAIYYISNQSVAANPMFVDKRMQEYFIKKMEHYLSPICNILAYDLSDNSFQFLLRLKDRQAFERHFLKKKRKMKLDILDIPDSTYLFSQAMANLQVSFVKHFNYKMNRSGTLMSGRFFRQLVESESEMEEWKERLNRSKKRKVYALEWVHRMKCSAVAYNSMWLYNEGFRGERRENDFYMNADTMNLGGYFQNLPKKRLPSTKNYFLKKFNCLFIPNLE